MFLMMILWSSSGDMLIVVENISTWKLTSILFWMEFNRIKYILPKYLEWKQTEKWVI